MKPLSPYEEQQLRRIRGPFAPATPLAEAHQLLTAIRRSCNVRDPQYSVRRARNESTPVAWRRKKAPDLILINTGAQPQVAENSGSCSQATSMPRAQKAA